MSRKIEVTPEFLLTMEQASDFLSRLAVHLEASDMLGKAGDCLIQARKVRCALNEVDPPGKIS